MLKKLSDGLEILNKDEIIDELTSYKYRINGGQPIDANEIYVDDAHV